MDVTQTAIDFYNAGNSLSATANHFNISVKSLKELLIKNGVHLRTQSEQLIQNNIKRSNGVNHYYFDTLTQESAYYLGFLAADCTVRKDNNGIKIGLSSVDKDFLEEMRKNINIENAIHVYQTANGYECAELRFSSLKIKQDLMKYGIVPNKTYIGTHLNLIPDEFKLAFIKGYFDGDGSFSYSEKTKQGAIKFTSYTKGILEEILDFLQIKGHIYLYKRGRNQLYSLEFSTLPSLEILNRFYQLDTPCLQRKKDKYLACLELRK